MVIIRHLASESVHSGSAHTTVQQAQEAAPLTQLPMWTAADCLHPRPQLAKLPSLQNNFMQQKHFNANYVNARAKNALLSLSI